MKCGATNRQGEPCGNPAGFKTPHPGWGNCHNHGGSSPSGIIHAKRLEQQASVAFYGEPIEQGPHEALLAEVHRSAGHVAWLQAQVATPEGYAQWGAEYREERKMAVAASTACAKAGVEERAVRITEALGVQLAGAMRRLVERLGERMGWSAQEMQAALEDARQEMLAAASEPPEPPRTLESG